MNNYVSGQWSATCDRCGFKFHSGQLRREPKTKLRVCAKCYDPFPAGDKPIKAKERGPLPWTRPEPPDMAMPAFAFRSSSGSLWGAYQQEDYALAIESISDFLGTILDEALLVDSTGTAWRLYIDDEGTPNTDSYTGDGLSFLRLSGGPRDRSALLKVDTSGAWTLEDDPEEELNVPTDPFL